MQVGKEQEIGYRISKYMQVGAEQEIRYKNKGGNKNKHKINSRQQMEALSRSAGGSGFSAALPGVRRTGASLRGDDMQRLQGEAAAHRGEHLLPVRQDAR